MPIADYPTYCKMLDNAYENHFAYPAINVVNMVSANAALKAFADKKSDGIIQVSTGGAAFASGINVKDMVAGAITIAEHVHRMADFYDVNIALHTDHCQADKIDSFLIPLIEESERRVAEGKLPLFQSHMLDCSAIPLKDNMDLSVPLLERMSKINQILEVEAGCVGGEEDGVCNEDAPADKLYTTPDDMTYVYDRLGSVKGAKYMFAATFGNVHGVYKPGNVKLKPTILKDGQDAIQAKFGDDAYFWLVFHGGSGSSLEEIRETLGYGVIKMNVDTDTQYAFTRPVVDHMLTNYEAVLKIEGEVGNKKLYDPRAWMKKAEEAMAARIGEACDSLQSTGKSLRA